MINFHEEARRAHEQCRDPQSGIVYGNDVVCRECVEKLLRRVAADASAAERERCARVAEGTAADALWSTHVLRNHIAANIRALATTTEAHGSAEPVSLEGNADLADAVHEMTGCLEDVGGRAVLVRCEAEAVLAALGHLPVATEANAGTSER